MARMGFGNKFCFKETSFSLAVLHKRPHACSQRQCGLELRPSMFSFKIAFPGVLQIFKVTRMERIPGFTLAVVPIIRRLPAGSAAGQGQEWAAVPGDPSIDGALTSDPFPITPPGSVVMWKGRSTIRFVDPGVLSLKLMALGGLWGIVFTVMRSWERNLFL